ncbi:MAG: hypothetical protein U0736_11560 [Gemmataceae bacterium]
MRRLLCRSLSTALLLTLTGLLAFGCAGSRRSDDDEDEGPRVRKTVRPQAAQLKPVKATEYGVIRGMVTWDGALPNMDQLAEELKKSMSANSDHQYCLTGKKPDDPADYQSTIQPFETTQQEYRIGDNKGLGNVMVWIEPPDGHYFEVPKDQLDAVAKEVRLTQPHCAFLPHCTVLFPSYRKDGAETPTGQKLIVDNDARVAHNANIKKPLSGTDNVLIPPTQKREYVMPVEKGFITVGCDVHKWMSAYLRAFDHPYAAVTSVGGDAAKKVWEDRKAPAFGSFEIKGVPVGAKVKLVVWHEKLGYLTGQKGKELTLKKENVENFSAGQK